MTLTLVKADLMWNDMHQDLYDRAKETVKNACMKYCNASGPLYLETDGSDFGLGARLLQVKVKVIHFI